MKSFRNKYPGLSENQLLIKYKIWQREKETQRLLNEAEEKKKYKETYKVLDSNLGLYSFTTNLCTKHFWEIHNFKEKVIGDFSVFFKENPEKSYHL